MIEFFISFYVISQLFSFVYKNTILQNQYYNLKRFFIFYFQKKLFIYDVVVILFSLLCSLFSNIWFFFTLLIFLKKHKKTKLLFTPRIKRHLAVFAFILLMFSFVLFNVQVTFSVSIICCLFPFWISFSLNAFIEKILSIFYIKQAKRKLNSYKTRVIGITGSYGKTSCKNYLYDLIKNEFHVLVSPHSFNTLNGLLKTINKSLMPYHDFFIAEIGVDCKNGMEKYLKVFNFYISAVTCVGKQHLKTFKTIANIAKEKKKLLINSKDFAIINYDDPLLCRTKTKVNQISFSTDSKDADVLVMNSTNKTINIKIYDKVYSVESNLVGKHNLSNLSCAIAIAKALKIQDNKIIKKIPKLKQTAHRLSVFSMNKWIIIDDSYNSNFIGFENALSILKTYTESIKVIITPGIIESNKEAKQNHKNLAAQINQVCDLVILINKPPFRKHIKKYLSFNDFLSAYTYLKEKYFDKKLTILIENDLPEIFIR